MSISEIAADWTDPGDAFLVSSRNYDGSLKLGPVHISEAHSLADAKELRPGYEMLANIEGDHDRHAYGGDLNFAELKVWTATSTHGVGAYGELVSPPETAALQLNPNATTAWTVDPVTPTGLVSHFTVSDVRTRALSDGWVMPEIPKPVAQTPAEPTAMVSVAPTEMQMGVLGLVDAMAAFGNGLANDSAAPDPSATSPVTPSTNSSGYMPITTTRQLVQALRQFDANGNPIPGQAGQQNSLSGLMANDAGRPPDTTAGLLAVGKG